MDRSRFLPALLGLYDMFDSLGFAVVSEESGGMGGYDLVLSGRLPGKSGDVPTFVNFNADRGFWAFTIKFGSMKKWTVAWVWRSYLDDVPVESENIEWQARFIADRLADMVAAVETDPGIEADLRKRGEEYMRQRHRSRKNAGDGGG